jgi:hypothetical protein
MVIPDASGFVITFDSSIAINPVDSLIIYSDINKISLLYSSSADGFSRGIDVPPLKIT